MISSASDWLRHRMATLPLLLDMKTPNKHPHIPGTDLKKLIHPYTDSHKPFLASTCLCCVCAGSQPCTHDFIYSVCVCKPSRGNKVSPLQGDIKHCSEVMHMELSDPHNWPDLLNGHLKIDSSSVWFLGWTEQYFSHTFLDSIKKKKKSNNFPVNHMRLYGIIFILWLFTDPIHPVWIMLPLPAPGPTTTTTTGL